MSQSGLAAFILEAVRTHQRGVGSIVLDFVKPDATGCNWRVAGVATGTADRDAALAAVDYVAGLNRENWIMVKDGSHLDGQLVGRETGL